MTELGADVRSIPESTLVCPIYQSALMKFFLKPFIISDAEVSYYTKWIAEQECFKSPSEVTQPKPSSSGIMYYVTYITDFLGLGSYFR